jgi:hypothetical protein
MATFNLTINNVPEELMQLIWHGANDLFNELTKDAVQRTDNIILDAEEIGLETAAEIIGTGVSGLMAEETYKVLINS